MENRPPLAGLDPADLLKQGVAEDTILEDEGKAFVPPTVADLAPLFPQFEFLELVGKGGMGAVYKVRQRELDRVVALKILPPSTEDEERFSKRFAREAKALAKLNHPGIVTLHEFGQQDGFCFIVMEFVDGMNLRQLMRSGRISAREALAIVPQICDALQFAHDQGIVHRDIKPENILLDRLGRVKVADFGIAKLVGAEDLSPAGASPGDPWVTEVGNVMGTPQYMAPEQIEQPTEVDHRADIYALGVVFYQMLTGELPDKRIEVPSKKVRIDVRLDEVVLQALESDPERRFQTAVQFRTAVDDLHAPMSGAAVASPPPSPARKRGMLRRWWWVFPAMVPVGVLLGLACGMIWWNMVPKKYESKALVELMAPAGEMKFPQFPATQFEIMRSSKNLGEVAEELELSRRWSISEERAIQILKKIVTVQLAWRSQRDTNLISIGVRSTNPDETLAILEAVVSKYQEKSKFPVVIHERAALPDKPLSPNKVWLLVTGSCAGLLASPLMALVLIVFLNLSTKRGNATVGVNRMPGKIWWVVPVAAVLLMVFNPWGAGAWVVFGLVCATVALSSISWRAKKRKGANEVGQFSISVRDTRAIRRWWWVFPAMVPMGVLLGTVFCLVWWEMAPKKYEAEAVVELKASDDEMFVPGFFPRQFQIVLSSNVLGAVAEDLELSRRWNISEEGAIRMLKTMVHPRILQGTHLICIRVSGADSDEALAILDTVVFNYQKNSRFPMLLQDRSATPVKLISPNVVLMLVLGACAGLITSPLMALVLIVFLHLGTQWEDDAEETNKMSGKIWRVVPVSAILLAVFNPWRSDVWVILGIVCAVVALLPGLFGAIAPGGDGRTVRRRVTTFMVFYGVALLFLSWKITWRNGDHRFPPRPAVTVGEKTEHVAATPQVAAETPAAPEVTAPRVSGPSAAAEETPATRKPAVEEKREVQIELGAGGSILLDGETIAIEALENRIKELAAKHANLKVQIKGGANVPYAEVIRVLDACGRAEVADVSFSPQGGTPDEESEEKMVILEKDLPPGNHLQIRKVSADPAAKQIVQSLPDGSSRTLGVANEVIICDRHIQSAGIKKDSDGYRVIVTLNPNGAARLAHATENPGGTLRLAIILGEKIHSSPVVQTQLGTHIEISGFRSSAECLELLASLWTWKEADAGESLPWLKLLDEGNHDACYGGLAAWAREFMPKEQFTRAMIQFRKPMGSLLSRHTQDVKEMKVLPGMPDGEYRIITFSVDFENKKGATEVVSMMKEADGKWSPAGYLIK